MCVGKMTFNRKVGILNINLHTLSSTAVLEVDARAARRMGLLLVQLPSSYLVGVEKALVVVVKSNSTSKIYSVSVLYHSSSFEVKYQFAP